jgi:hypothetical protein
MDRVLHRLEVLAMGITSRELSAFVRLGVIARIGRGIYTMGEVLGLPDPRGITRSTRTVLSHISAAAWWGADLVVPAEKLHVTAPRNRGRRSDCLPLVQLHRADLRPEEIRRVRGVLVTSPLRTVLDIARSLPLAHAVAIADSLARKRLVSSRELLRTASAMPAGPGRTAVRKVAALLDPLSGSVFESITRVSMAIAGLPAPTTQLNIYDTAGEWVARVDFAWPDLRVVLECDGFEFHSSRASFESDRRRWNALTRAGWRVIAVTWHDVVNDPTYLVELMSDVLAA